VALAGIAAGGVLAVGVVAFFVLSGGKPPEAGNSASGTGTGTAAAAAKTAEVPADPGELTSPPPDQPNPSDPPKAFTWRHPRPLYPKGIEGHGSGSPITAAAFSADSKVMATAGGRVIKIWDAVTGERKLALEGHGWDVNCVAFSPIGRKLASGGKDGEVRVWDGEAGTELKSMKFSGSVRGVAFSADGRLLAVGGADKAVRIIRVADFAPVAELVLDHAVDALTFSDDGKWLFVGCVTSGESFRVHSVGGEWRQVVRKGNPRGGTDFLGLAGSPDGRHVALSLTRYAKKSVLLWNREGESDWGEPRELTGHTGFVFAMAYSPDSAILATSGGDGTVRLWDTATGAQTAVFDSGIPKRVGALAFSPDGKRLLAGGHDGIVKGWEPGPEP
jgi:WD40 repeat protein